MTGQDISTKNLAAASEPITDFQPVGGATIALTPLAVLVTLETDQWSGVLTEVEGANYPNGLDFSLSPPEMSSGSAIEFGFSIDLKTVAFRYRFLKTDEGLFDVFYYLGDAGTKVSALQGMWINTKTNKARCRVLDPRAKGRWIPLMTNLQNLADTIYWYYNIETGEWEWGYDSTEPQLTTLSSEIAFDTFVMRGSVQGLNSSLGTLTVLAKNTGERMALGGYIRETAFGFPACKD